MAPLDRALALTDRDGPALAVGGDLDLDVTGTVDQPLDIDPPVAEVRLALGLRAVVGRREVLSSPDHPHALAAPAGDRLEQHREAVLGDEGLELGERLERLHQPRYHRRSGGGRELAGLGLGAHQTDRVGRRSDPGQPGIADPFRSDGVLGQEAVTRMHQVGAARLRHFEHPVEVEIAGARRRRADRERLVGHQHVRCEPIHLGVDRHRLEAHLAAGADDPHRDLAPVRDQELHRGTPLTAGCCRASWAASSRVWSPAGRMQPPACGAGIAGG